MFIVGTQARTAKRCVMGAAAHLGDGCCQRGLAVIDVANGTHVNVRLGAAIDVVAEAAGCACQPPRWRRSAGPALPAEARRPRDWKY